VYPDGFGAQQHKNNRSLHAYFQHKQQGFKSPLDVLFETGTFESN